MTQLYEFKVNLSDNQKTNLARAWKNKETIVLRLSSSALNGNDKLMVPRNIVKRLNKHRELKKRHGYKTC